MPRVNVGACNARGAPVQTKKELKELLTADPSNVLFYHTSMFNGPLVFSGSQILDDTILSVCGPDPSTNRKWWATVS